MLQRLQSLFLLGVALCMLLVIFFPIWEKYVADSDEKVTLNAFSATHYRVETAEGSSINPVIEEEGAYAIAILAVLASILAFVEIFSYKSRLRQMKLGFFNTLLIITVVGLMMYYSFQWNEKISPQLTGVYQVGFYLPLGALLFNILANRFIRRDEMLVRSVDRLR